ncbi:MAG: 2'-deoxycytidine 5'-triphosphate deaminase [Thermodesulfobacteriota bacterium]
MSAHENNTNKGLFSYQDLKALLRSRAVASSVDPVTEEQVQPASIDLRLGAKAYRLVSSFLPESHGVLERLGDGGGDASDLVMYEIDISEGGILEKGHVYLIPLMEELDLPAGVRGRANPKSTTGRLDVFARVLSDNNPRFDDIAAGYKGGLYLEILPRSFAIGVKQGLSLVQLRLMDGDCLVDDADLQELQETEGILYDGESDGLVKGVSIGKGLFMSVDLSGEAMGGIIGYRSRKNSHVVDLTKRDYYDIVDFWEPVRASKNSTLILEPEEFYILSSMEKIRIPTGYAAEMAAYEAGSGELRTHYAGFFDPGFGYGSSGEVLGTKAVLEVRAHDVPFMISHGQTFCKLAYERMRDVPEKTYGPKIGSSYQFQGITLSKQFKKPS